MAENFAEDFRRKHLVFIFVKNTNDTGHINPFFICVQTYSTGNLSFDIERFAIGTHKLHGQTKPGYAYLKDGHMCTFHSLRT